MTPRDLALLDLRRRPAATILAAASIALAAAAGSFLVTLLGHNASRIDRLPTEWHMVVGPKNNTLGLVLEGLDLFRPSEEVIPYWLVGRLRRENPARLLSLHVFARHRGAYVIAVEDDYLQRPADMTQPHVVAGRWFERGGEAVLGYKAAAKLGLRIGDSFMVRNSPSERLARDAVMRLPQLAARDAYQVASTPFQEDLERPLYERQLTVVGIVSHGGGAFDKAIFVNQATGRAHYDLTFREGTARRVSQEGATTYLLIRFNRLDDFGYFWPLLQHTGTVQAVGVAEEKENLRALEGRARLVATGVTGLVVLMALLGVAVLLNARFDGLRRHLGVLRALGYRQGEIAAWLMWEGILLGAAAVAAAVVVEAVLVLGPLPQLLGLAEETPAWPTMGNLYVWGAILLAGALSVVVPLIRLYRSDTRRALQGA